MTRSWEDLRPELDRLVFQRSAASVAREMGVDTGTVYRILRGTHTPHHLTQEAAQRVLDSRHDLDARG